VRQSCLKKKKQCLQFSFIGRMYTTASDNLDGRPPRHPWVRVEHNHPIDESNIGRVGAQPGTHPMNMAQAFLAVALLFERDNTCK